MRNAQSKSIFGAILLGSLSVAILPADAHYRQGPVDSSSKYTWQPVRLGAGGYVVGFVTHPLSASVRYARTDVGNAYRWDTGKNEWMPMKVVNPNGTGMPANVITAPAGSGVQSIAIDPTNVNVVYMATPNEHSNDVGGGIGISIYRSADGGKTFRASNLNVPGNPNDDYRTQGERIAVDPNNPKVVYFGTGYATNTRTGSGVYRSVDSGLTWTKLTVKNAFEPADNIINMVVARTSGLTAGTPFGTAVGKVSKVIYARGGRHVSNAFYSDLYGSVDGGVNWTNLSKGTAIAGKVGRISIDAKGTLYVLKDVAREAWKYSAGKWSSFAVGTNDITQCLEVDPKNLNRMFAIGWDASVSRSLDGGKNWVNFGRLQYANTLGWLPQVAGDKEAYGYRSTGGIMLDAAGTLWVCQGNEGMLRYTPLANNSENGSKPPKWIIDSKGIEEFVSQDIIVPKGSGDRIYTAVQDGTGFVIPNPDTFSATQVPLQTSLISQGTQVASCPGDPNTVAVSSSGVYVLGKNESGISFDAGKTWTKFGPALRYTNQWGTFDVQAGSIAISRRGNWKAGADHIVQWPVYSVVPIYSKDGGKTWKPTKSFPTNPDGLFLKDGGEFSGYWTFALKLRTVYADPFVADKFYLKFVYAPEQLYVSTDGGVNWVAQKKNGLPNATFHGQLAVNQNVQNDLWFADGWEGATEHGLYHSKDGGKTFVKIPGITNAITLALGAGSGVKGDATYSVYFYGKFEKDAKWGVFRSTNGGTSWERVSYYPTGIYDQPTCMAASWDNFGKVYVGFNGNSFVYGKPTGTRQP